MPDEKTRADSIRLYLTGAASDGSAQADADAALGDYRSSTEVEAIGMTFASPIAGLTIDYLSGACGEGSHTVTANTVDTVSFTAAGGTQGDAVSIANGQTKILETAGDPTKFVRVSRASASDLAGEVTITAVYQVNNGVGMDNITSAEATAGDDEYRCLCIKNESGIEIAGLAAAIATLGTQRTASGGQLSSSGAGSIVTIQSLADWPEQGYCHIRTSGGTTREIVYYTSRTLTTLTVPAAGRGLLGTSAGAGSASDTIDAVPGIRLAREDPTGSASTGNAQTIADEDTAPTGRTWSAGVTKDTGVDFETLGAGEIVFLWIHRQTPAGAAADPAALHQLTLYVDAA